ncbi:MAG: LysM peptidoglycan-binding domain-containing protein [Bdellovibrionales bacterium]|nr:LysM peptidoglycan-binding domain-containing protein [Bdellovibrionales bacterium]
MGAVRACTLICLALINSGCSLVKSGHWSSDSEVHYFEHTVHHRGETLSDLADWYTGSWRNWIVIAQHNPAISVHSIKIGETIRIPETLLVNRQAYPRAYLARINNRFQQTLEADGVQYKVSSIKGCENLPNDSEGLQACTDRINAQLP